MRYYHRTMLAFLFSQLFFISSKCQKLLVTEVVIIGTKHTPNPSYNSDSLMKAVLNLKPDVILIEYDSTSFAFRTGEFKPLPGWSIFLRKVGVRSKLGPDDEMFQRFHRQFPQVVFKPFDVAFNGAERDRYIDNLFQLEDEFFPALEEAFDKKEMSEYRAKEHLNRRYLISFFSERLNGPLQGFNDDSITVVARQGEELEKLHFIAVVDSVPSLQRFTSRIYDRIQMAEHRNKIMVQQILRFVNEYRGKRIVVITGVLHRYYQLDNLASKREQFNFRILDINGAEMTFPL